MEPTDSAYLLFIPSMLCNDVRCRERICVLRNVGNQGRKENTTDQMTGNLHLRLESCDCWLFSLSTKIVSCQGIMQGVQRGSAGTHSITSQLARILFGSCDRSKVE